MKDKFDVYHRYIEPYMERFLVGFFVIFALIVFLEYLSLGFIHTLGFINLETISGYSPYLLLYNLFTNVLFAWAVWFFSFIKYPKFAPDEVGILIALTKIDERADTELEKLYRQLEDLINTENLTARVIVRILPDRLKPKNINFAEKLGIRFKAQLVIWGQVDYGSEGSVQKTVFVPIHFTYGLNLRPVDALSFGKGINHVFANRNWFVRDENSIMDGGYLARNTQEVSLYILGSALFFKGRYDESLEILRKMLGKYKVKTNSSPDDSIAIANLKNLLSSLYLKMGNNISLKPNSKNKEENILKMQDIVLKMTEDGFKEGALTLGAQIEFAKNGVSAKGKKLLRDAHTLNPTSPAQCFSLAFLYFYEGDLKNGLLWLINALNRRSSLAMMDQTPSIIAWYTEALEEDSSKEWLHLPLGVLCWVFLKDKENAESSLKIFLEKYWQPSNPALKPVFSYTQQTLKKIKKAHK